MNLNLNKLFSPAQLDMVGSNAKYQVMYGGRGGTKTTGFLRKAALRMSLNPDKKLTLMLARELQISLADSMVPALRSAIEEMGLDKMWDMDLKIPQPIFGGRVFSMGLAGKSASALKALHAIDICLVDELQDMRTSTARTLLPTLWRTPYCQFWGAGNPENENDWFYERFVIDPEPTDYVRFVSYEDNPWFDEEAEKLRLRDKKTLTKEEYEHIWLGKLKPKGRGRLINVNEWNQLAAPRPDSPATLYLGADLSMRRDASAIVWLWQHDEGVWLEPWIYATKESIKRIKNGEAYYLSGQLRESDKYGEIDRNAIAKDIQERLSMVDCERVHFDPYAAVNLKALADLFPRTTFKPLRASFQTEDEPTRMLKSLIRNQAIYHNGNPIMTWMMGNAEEASDVRDGIRYIRPQKPADKHELIDGVAATVYALSAMIAGPSSLQGEGGVWEQDANGRWQLVN